MQNMVARPKITLYVDTVSPFAYEAYWILRVSETCNDWSGTGLES